MAKGGKKKAAVKRQKQMEVEEEPGGRWVAGVSAETGEDFIAMDTAEGPAKPRAAQQGVGLAKPQQGKRGNRTRNQKRRKSANLEKALAFTSKFETKSLSAGSAGTARKQAKGLWSKDDGGAGALP